MTIGAGYDKIKDFKDGQDKIDISGLNDWSLVDSGKAVKLFGNGDYLAKIYGVEVEDLTQSGDYLI